MPGCPEQAEGRLDLLGPASDVYSLGATLYCLLTGRPPVQGETMDAILEAVRRGDITPPQRVNPQAPPALAAVCQKALATDPEDRYSSPAELSADIERWLADEPVTAVEEPFGLAAFGNGVVD